MAYALKRITIRRAPLSPECLSAHTEQRKMRFVVYRIRGYPYPVNSLTCPQVNVAGLRDSICFFLSGALQNNLQQASDRVVSSPEPGFFYVKKPGPSPGFDYFGSGRLRTQRPHHDQTETRSSLRFTTARAGT